MRRAHKENVGLLHERRTEQRWCWIMLAIPVIGFAVLTVYPILWTFRWAFYSYTGVDSTAVFIGMRNFKALFTTDFTYWKSWLTTLQFTLLKVPVELAFAMCLALILSRSIRGTNFFRSVFYLPSVISVVIIGLVFSNLFSFFGVVNGILQNLGIIDTGIDWFANKNTAMAVIVIGSIWNTLGINVMYFMAALTNVPKEIYECADLDGAGSFTKFFKITLPMIIPVAQIILLLSVVGTLGINEYILTLTNGAPSGMTHSVISYQTTQFVPGFAQKSVPELGYGCAMSLITTLLFALVAIGYNKLNNKLKDIS